MGKGRSHRCVVHLPIGPQLALQAITGNVLCSSVMTDCACFHLSGFGTPTLEGELRGPVAPFTTRAASRMARVSRCSSGAALAYILTFYMAAAEHSPWDRIQHSTHIVDPKTGLRHHYESNAQIHPDAVVLSHLDGMLHHDGVSCDGVHGEHVTLRFEDEKSCLAAAAMLQPTALLVGHGAWRCRHASARRHMAAMLDVVEFVPSLPAKTCGSAAGPSLHLITRMAALTEVFRVAHVRMRSNAHANASAAKEQGLLPMPHNIDARIPAPPQRPIRAHPVGCWFCFITDAFEAVVNTIKTIATVVEDVAQTVWVVGQLLATGDFQGDITQQVASFGINRTIQLGTLEGNGSLSCVNCGVQVNVDFVLNIDIEDYTLQSAYVALEGFALMSAMLSVEWQEDVSFVNQQVNIGNITSPSIDFVIGPIPVSAQIIVPLDVSWSLTGSASLSVVAGGAFSGNVAYGIAYNTTNGWTYIHTTQFESSPQPVSSLNVAAQFTASVSFLPSLVVQIDYIGGPVLGLRVTAESTLVFDTSGSCPSIIGNMGASLSVNINEESTIGAQINIGFTNEPVISWSSPATTIFLLKFPLFSGCLFGASGSGLLAIGEELDSSSSTTSATSSTGGNVYPGFNTVGAVWIGNQTRISPDPSCNLIPDLLYVFAQAIPDDNGNPQLMQTVSGFWPNGLGYCTLQALFSVSTPDQSHVIMNPLNNGDGEIVGYSRCAGNSTFGIQVNGVEAHATGNFHTIYTRDDCTSYSITRRSFNITGMYV